MKLTESFRYRAKKEKDFGIQMSNKVVERVEKNRILNIFQMAVKENKNVSAHR